MKQIRSKPHITNVNKADGQERISFTQLLFSGALGAGAVMVLSALQRYHLGEPAEVLRANLKTMEKTSLRQIRKADENSTERNKILDKNNKWRLQKLSSEVIGECRANFDILSQQIHCLTQIALQTLTTLAKPIAETPGGGDDLLEEIEKERQKVLEWSRKAQREADKLVNPESIISRRKSNVERMVSKLPQLGEEAVTPISEQPRILVEVRHKRKEKDKGIYRRWGMGCLGCTAIIGSMYFLSSPKTESSRM